MSSSLVWPDPWKERDWDITIEQLVAWKFILVMTFKLMSQYTSHASSSLSTDHQILTLPVDHCSVAMSETPSLCGMRSGHTRLDWLRVLLTTVCVYIGRVQLTVQPYFLWRYSFTLLHIPVIALLWACSLCC